MDTQLTFGNRDFLRNFAGVVFDDADVVAGVFLARLHTNSRVVVDSESTACSGESRISKRGRRIGESVAEPPDAEQFRSCDGQRCLLYFTRINNPVAKQPKKIITRHRASTSMYLLTFCVRFLLPEHHQRKPAVQAAAVILRTPPVDGQSPASQPRPLPIYGAQF